MGVEQATPTQAVTRTNNIAVCAAEERCVISSSRSGGRASPLCFAVVLAALVFVSVKTCARTLSHDRGNLQNCLVLFLEKSGEHVRWAKRPAFGCLAEGLSAVFDYYHD